jgi:hypothetical protein
VTGHEALVTLRAALHVAAEELGVRVQFAPGTPPDVVDWFGLPALSAASGALGGGAVGLLVGALFEHPVAGVVVGAVVGGVAGGVAGANAVKQGWRLRFTWLPSGEPQAFLEPVG